MNERNSPQKPVTYKVVAFLKRAEDEDYFDYNTDFTPFSIEV